MNEVMEFERRLNEAAETAQNEGFAHTHRALMRVLKALEQVSHAEIPAPQTALSGDRQAHLH